MNTRENRYNVGIQNKRRASTANAVQSDCGLNERYYATSAGTEKERKKEKKISMNITGYAIAKEY